MSETAPEMLSRLGDDGRRREAASPDPAELKRLIEDVKTKWYGFAIGTHSGIAAVTASAALYAILGIPAYAEVEK